MDNRLNDLMKQGFMKPRKATKNTRTDSERAQELSDLAGVHVTLGNRKGSYVVPHPFGHNNHLTYTEAKKIIKMTWLNPEIMNQARRERYD